MLLLVLAVGTALAAPRAQDYDYEDEDLPIATEIPTEGFWPTKLMLSRILDRMLDEAADHYSLDEEQTERTREMMHERIPEFMDTNRAELQTLVNQFFEAQMNDEPPDPEMVALWSKRALRMSGRVRDLFDDMTDSMREYLNDDQQTLLDSEHAAFETGFGLMTNKLKVWASGGYDPEVDWTGPGAERRARERDERLAMEAAMEQAREDTLNEAVQPDQTPPAAMPQAASSQPAAEKITDEWAIYTQEFIERYELNVDQQNKAVGWLRAKQRQRDEYLKRKTDDMDRLDAALKDAKTDADKQRAQDDIEKLNAPVARMFADLKERLDTLPTRAQRRAAIARAASQPASAPREQAPPASAPK